MIVYFRKVTWKISSLLPSFKGKERIVSILSRPLKGSQIKIKRQGIIWSLYGHDLNEFSVAVRKNHSPVLSNAIRRVLNKENLSVMWDIGANIGAISLPLLLTYPKLNIVMFEPSPEVAGRLIANFQNNPLINKRGQIFNLALSNVDGLSEFYVSDEIENSGLAGLGGSLNRSVYPVKLQSYRGDTLIKAGNVQSPQLIKVDVEGFEYEVFLGLENTLRVYKPTIIFEHALYRITERNHDKRLVVDLLESFGYKIYRIEDGSPIEPLDLEKDADFIAR
jgi:FkbM family methyltransferase